jgi:cytochrome c biogenesis protein CcmG/thiol:disulfide interchange protein DsbE
MKCCFQTWFGQKKIPFQALRGIFGWKSFLACAGILLGSVWQAHGAFGIEVGTALPQLSLPAVKGERFSTDKTKGKITIINFWATWCEACKIELVEMEEQFKIFRNEKEVQKIFVNLDKDPRQAVLWAKQTLKDPGGFLASNYLDGGFDVADLLKVDSFPMTLVIDRQGKVVYKQKGFNSGEKMTEKLVEIVRGHLKGNT